MASKWRIVRASWMCAARRGQTSTAMRCSQQLRPSLQLLSSSSSSAVSRVQRQQQNRVHWFSTNAGNSNDAMDEDRFLQLADSMLHEIVDWLDGIEEMLEDSDISLSQGVLKIDLGEDGTWVINRQIPNRQIWWSSPISGPRRYEYDASSGKWLSTRDGTEMMERLRNEIEEATDIEIY